jgi:hypothetical protein
VSRMAYLCPSWVKGFIKNVLGAIHLAILELLCDLDFGVGAGTNPWAGHRAAHMLFAMHYLATDWNVQRWPPASRPRPTSDQRFSQEDIQPENIHKLKGMCDLSFWVHWVGPSDSTFLRRKALFSHWVHRELD